MAIKVNNLYLMNRCGYNHWSRLCECDCRALNRDVTMRIWEVGCVRLVPARFYALRSRSCKPSHRYFYKPMITAWIHKQGSVFFEVYFSLIRGFSRVFVFFFFFHRLGVFWRQFFYIGKKIRVCRKHVTLFISLLESLLLACFYRPGVETKHIYKPLFINQLKT